MPFIPPQLDLHQLRIRPLKERHSLTRVADILIDPQSPPPATSLPTTEAIANCARRIRAARERGAAVFLIYGAHLLRNGTACIVRELLARKWITHLATNGAGSIHDWEYAWGGASTERVEENVSSGTFGMWQETATCIHAAVLAGALDGLGYGASVGRFIAENGAHIPSAQTLEAQLGAEPRHPMSSARADVLDALARGLLREGTLSVPHPYPQASILASAWLHQVPATVHPGIGYDIISNHPLFTGSALGRAGATDFRVFGAGVEQLDHGVVLSVGSAIMGPQVFEKSISCVNNIRIQQGRRIVHGHSIDVVDLQDGGNWDWSRGEPPKSNPAYYLRFCKSFSRMNGTMIYHQCDNAVFIHHLLHLLAQS
jgi:hypothetical protein